MIKDTLKNCNYISAIITYSYAKNIERIYKYYPTLDVISTISIEVFKRIETRIDEMVAVEFNKAVLVEAADILLTKYSIHVDRT